MPTLEELIAARDEKKSAKDERKAARREDEATRVREEKQRRKDKLAAQLAAQGKTLPRLTAEETLKE